MVNQIRIHFELWGTLISGLSLLFFPFCLESGAVLGLMELRLIVAVDLPETALVDKMEFTPCSFYLF